MATLPCFNSMSFDKGSISNTSSNHLIFCRPLYLLLPIFPAEMRWLDNIINSVGKNLSKLQEIVEDREAQSAAVHGVTKSQTRFSDWSRTTFPNISWWSVNWSRIFSDYKSVQSLSRVRLLCWWCHPTISSSVILFSSCLQSCPAPGFFSMSQVLHIRWPKVFELQPQHQSFQWTLRTDFL